MFKRILVVFFILGVLPVFAGQYEDAIKNNNKVIVYFYTPTCRACKQFSPFYEQMAKKYGKNSKFIKLDATTQYGFNLYRQTGARYVPFVIMVNSSDKKGNYIPGDCVMDSVCAEKVISKFTN